jgi:hypothetical protein
MDFDFKSLVKGIQIGERDSHKSQGRAELQLRSCPGGILE